MSKLFSSLFQNKSACKIIYMKGFAWGLVISWKRGKRQLKYGPFVPAEIYPFSKILTTPSLVHFSNTKSSHYYLFWAENHLVNNICASESRFMDKVWPPKCFLENKILYFSQSSYQPYDCYCTLKYILIIQVFNNKILF